MPIQIVFKCPLLSRLYSPGFLKMIRISHTEAINEPLLSLEEEVEAIRRWQQEGHTESLALLVKSHARVAYATARRYTNNPTHLDDLAAEGIVGLMKAADKFDPSKGTRYGTYSRWWVMTCITQGLPKVSTVIDISSRTLIDAKMGRLEGPDKDKAHAAVYGGIHLDAPISEEEGMTAMDLLECPKMNPEQVAQANSEEDFRRQMLQECLGELNKRERQIIERRKLSPHPETLEQISNDIGVTRERVRQIESRALARLKRSLSAKGFSVSMLRQ
jgi:RNA polymerase sigma-32 factor